MSIACQIDALFKRIPELSAGGQTEALLLLRDRLNKTKSGTGITMREELDAFDCPVKKPVSTAQPSPAVNMVHFEIVAMDVGMPKLHCRLPSPPKLEDLVEHILVAYGIDVRVRPAFLLYSFESDIPNAITPNAITSWFMLSTQEELDYVVQRRMDIAFMKAEVDCPVLLRLVDDYTRSSK